MSAVKCRTPRSAAGAAERENTAESLTAAPVCCSGLVRHGLRPNKAATIRLPHHAPPPRPHPGRAAERRPPLRPPPGKRPQQLCLRILSPPPTTPNALASFQTDNYLSATEDQSLVGVRVPNTPLSSRGRGRDNIPRESLTGGPGLLQRTGSARIAPEQSREDQTTASQPPPRPHPRRPARRRLRPARTDGGRTPTPRPRGSHESGDHRCRPGPPRAGTATIGDARRWRLHVSDPSDATASVGECRTPRSATGRGEALAPGWIDGAAGLLQRVVRPPGNDGRLLNVAFGRPSRVPSR